MKIKHLIILIIPLLACCSSDDPRVVGQWRVLSNFYDASYQISKTDDGYEGIVCRYDDGTQVYVKSSDVKHSIFNNLIYQDSVYVDAISGATQTESNSNYILKILEEDTLQVTSYVMGKPIIEKWVRIK